MSRVLIVDDEESICWGLKNALTDEGFEVETAAHAEDALEAIERRRPDLAMFDVRLPGLDGLSAMEQVRRSGEPFPIIVMTAYGDLETAVRAVRGGAFDYLTKPFDLDRAVAAVRRAVTNLEREPVVDAERNDVAETDLMLGRSPAIHDVFKRIALAAPTDASVLLVGESGTGKELAARAVHRYSQYADGPFIPIHLAALSPTLVESELFGHVRGAYTGAEVERMGLLEAADGGTVFFDEAADIPPLLQVKLLRVLERRELTRVGDVQPRPCRFRVVAAVNRDPAECVRLGSLRRDLYYRLAGFEIRLPPLGERIDDITLLAEHFLRRTAASLTTAARKELERRPWPGNVRELRNVVEQAAILARGGLIEPVHLPMASITLSASQKEAEELRVAAVHWAERACQADDAQGAIYERMLDVVEPAVFDVVLGLTGGNRAAAAERLGIHRATLRKKLQERRAESDDDSPDDSTTSSE